MILKPMLNFIFDHFPGKIIIQILVKNVQLKLYCPNCI